MLKAITFDCWGTLVDIHHDLKAQRVAYLAQAVGCSETEALAAFDQSWAVYRQATVEGLGLAPAMLLNSSLGHLSRALRPPDYQRVLRYWQEQLLNDPPDLLPGAATVLRRLRGEGYLIGLISDTGVTPGWVLRRMLTQYGLLAHFDWLTFSDEMGVAKAHPLAFRATCAALGVAPEQALHVGDSPDADIDGAHQAGLRAALLLENSQRAWGRDRADLVLERLVDLPKALAKLQD